jgi:hypothetical protein
MCSGRVSNLAHVGGRFGQRSRLVKINFAFSLLKSEVQVTLYFIHLSFMKNVDIMFIEIYRIRKVF